MPASSGLRNQPSPKNKLECLYLSHLWHVSYSCDMDEDYTVLLFFRNIFLCYPYIERAKMKDKESI